MKIENILTTNSNISILSSIIHRYSIYKDKYNKISIDIYLELVHPKNKYIKMTFEDVKECSFYWNETYSFYNIETYKYFFQNDLHYISFDPDVSNENISENDRDIIKCSKLTVSQKDCFKHDY